MTKGIKLVKFKDSYYLQDAFKEYTFPIKVKYDNSNKCWYTDNIYKMVFIITHLKRKGLVVNASQDVFLELKDLLNNINLSYSDTSKSKELKAILGNSALYPYQIAGVEYLMNHKNSILADEQGLGKTLQIISFIDVSQFDKILIICPASLKLNWKNEILRWGQRSYTIDVIDGTKHIVNEDANVIICNYDLLSYNAVAHQIKRLSFDLGVYDEAHMLKNPKAKRTQVVLGYRGSKCLVDICSRNVALTGTPIPNKPIEMYRLLKKLCPEAIESMDYKRYGFYFCSGFLTHWRVFDVNGSSNELELGIRLRSHCMLRRTKKQVLPQLPDKTHQIITLEQDQDTKKLVTQEKKLDINAIMKCTTPIQFEGLAELRKNMAEAKVPMCIDYIQSFLENSKEKIVIFAYHKKVISMLKEALSDFGVVVIDGSANTVDRQKAVDLFQKDEKTKVFIGNIQAAGSGITLTAASNIFFVEISWTPGEMDQAVDRCHRIGQDMPVTARYLVVDGSLDSLMITKVLNKKKVISKILT